MKTVFFLLTSLVLVLNADFIENKRNLNWWETAMFYQIDIRYFADSDGDGIGDLNGITSKLNYIKDIGVDAISISPIYDFAYDISDFDTLHNDYGTMKDFEALIEKANEQRMKVILGFVPNHTSNESFWFQEALNGNQKYFNYFIWQDGVIDQNGKKQPPNNWLSRLSESSWTYGEDLKKFYFHQFESRQPDLNFSNPEVKDTLMNILSDWVDAGIDGFRFYDVNYLFEVDKELYGGLYPNEPPSGRMDVDPKSYDSLEHIFTKNQNETYYMVYQWRVVFDELKKNDKITKVMMTEAYTTTQNVVKYFGEGDFEGAQIPLNFNLITGVNASSSASDIKEAVDNFLKYKPLDKHANWVAGSYGENRISIRYRSPLIDGMNIIVLLLPGIAISYMGDEIGLVNGCVIWGNNIEPSGCNNTNNKNNYGKSSGDPERTSNGKINTGLSTVNATGLPVAGGNGMLNVELQKTTERSHLKVYQSLAALRRDKVFRYGEYDSLALNDDIFAFRRWYKNETYLMIINMRDEEHVVDLTYFKNTYGRVRVILASVQSPKKEGDKFDAAALPVAAFEGIVLKLQ